MPEKRFNKTLVLFCVFIFIIFAPVLLFYVLGYKYDLEGKKIIKTGGLYMSFWPDSADVYIDGIIKQKRYRIDITNGLTQTIQEENILPGNHKIKVALEGYNDWEKEIRIDESKVAILENILLIPKNSEKQKLTDFKNKSIENLTFSPAKNKIAFLSYDKTNNQNDAEKIPDLWQVDLKTEKTNIILNKNSIKTLLKLKDTAKKINIDNILWSPDESKILFNIEFDNTAKWAIADQTSKQTKILDETDKKIGVTNKSDENTNIMDPSWTSDGSRLLFIKNNGLFIKNINSANPSAVYLKSNVTAFSLKNNDVYFTSNNVLYKASLTDLINGELHSSILSNIAIPKVNPVNSSSNPYVKIIISGNNDIFAIDSKKTLYYLDKNKIFEPINDNIVDAKLSPNNEIMAFSTQYEIWSYYLKNNTVIRKNKNTKELIIRYSGNISSFDWLDDSMHFVFLVDNQVKITEIDNRDYRQTLNLFQQDQIKEFIHKDEKDAIYNIIIEKEDQNLYLTEIKKR